jgi:hypothetical protein
MPGSRFLLAFPEECGFRFQHSKQGEIMRHRITTGFDLEPLASGNALSAKPKENPKAPATQRNVPPPSPRENPTKADCASAPGNGVVFELGPQTLRLLAEIGADIKRLADHFAPAPSDIIGTPHLANRLGCTPTWIAQMVRSGEIPKGCIVPGSGKGKQWKFYRLRIEEWLASR